MFKAIFEGLASASQSSAPLATYNAPTSSGKKDEDPRKKVDSVTLRSDIYKAMELAHNWMAGGNVGDGLGYRAILVRQKTLLQSPSLQQTKNQFTLLFVFFSPTGNPHTTPNALPRALVLSNHPHL